jgi:DNA-damage-inducible protein J
MAKDSSMNVRIDSEVKARAEQVYAQYGMSVSEAVTVFLHKSIMVDGLPFDLRPSVPNRETIAAMAEGDKIIASGKSRFKNASEMFDDLGI